MLSFLIASDVLDEEKKPHPPCSSLNPAILNLGFEQVKKLGGSLEFPGKTQGEILKLFQQCTQEWRTNLPSSK